MGCCVVAKANLGKPPEWMMRMYLRLVIVGISKEAQPSMEDYWKVVDLKDDVIDLIGELAGMPVHKNAPIREGEYSVENSFKKYEVAMREGRRCCT